MNLFSVNLWIFKKYFFPPSFFSKLIQWIPSEHFVVSIRCYFSWRNHKVSYNDFWAFAIYHGVLHFQIQDWQWNRFRFLWIPLKFGLHCLSFLDSWKKYQKVDSTYILFNFLILIVWILNPNFKNTRSKNINPAYSVAYLRFFKVLLRCLSFSIVSLLNPFSLSFRLRSFMFNDANSSSVTIPLNWEPNSSNSMSSILTMGLMVKLILLLLNWKKILIEKMISKV